MLGQDFDNYGLTLRYAVDEARLTSRLRESFVPMALDTEGEAFVVRALQREHSRWTRRLHWLLTRFASDFDVNGWLNTHSVFLLSTPQAMQLLPNSHDQVLIDVGAGSGDVTTRLAALFREVRCTEVSRPMARRLRSRGLSCFEGEVLQGNSGDPFADDFDVVSLCNVLDRCHRPRPLLQAISEKLLPGHRLLLSLPLPYHPHHYRGGRTFDPEAPLDVSSQQFEPALQELWTKELGPLGLRLHAWSRMPYLSMGNDLMPLVHLDAAVLCCEKAES